MYADIHVFEIWRRILIQWIANVCFIQTRKPCTVCTSKHINLVEYVLRIWSGIFKDDCSMCVHMRYIHSYIKNSVYLLLFFIICNRQQPDEFCACNCTLPKRDLVLCVQIMSVSFLYMALKVTDCVLNMCPHRPYVEHVSALSTSRTRKCWRWTKPIQP